MSQFDSLDAPVKMRRDISKFANCKLILTGLLAAVFWAQPVQAGDTRYSYDALGRVTQALYPDGAAVGYAYDKAGNRVQKINTTGCSGTSSQILGHFSDFNCDGFGDLIFQNSSTQSISIWRMVYDSAGLRVLRNSVTTSVNANWTVRGTLDFNGDGIADILWRNAVTGQFTIWGGTGGAFTPNVYMDSTYTPATAIHGLADFNGDGKTDILFRDTNGTLRIWQSTGTGFVQDAYVNTLVDSTWHVQSTADFSGDGKADILWRHNSGMVTEWQSNGNGFIDNVFQDTTVETTYHVAAAGDFNGDGKADLIWRNDSGFFTQWISTGNGFAKNVYTNNDVEPGWQLANALDVSGDGKYDLVWRNSDGTFTIWLSTGTAFSPNALIDGSQSSAYTVVANPSDGI